MLEGNGNWVSGSILGAPGTSPGLAILYGLIELRSSHGNGLRPGLVPGAPRLDQNAAKDNRFSLQRYRWQGVLPHATPGASASGIGHQAV